VRPRLLVFAGLLALAAAAALYAFGRGPGDLARPGRLAPAAGLEREALPPSAPGGGAFSRPDAGTPAEAVAPPLDPERPAEPGRPEHAHELATDTPDFELYRGRPMSAVPHRIVRAWGAAGGSETPGMVGAFVVVEPGISDEELARLCRDIRAYHQGAKALSVRVLDSEEAATYDRHADGGALAKRHLVASVSRSEGLGLDSIEVRGAPIEP